MASGNGPNPLSYCTQQHCHKCHGNCGHGQQVKNKEVILLTTNELIQINTIPHINNQKH